MECEDRIFTDRADAGRALAARVVEVMGGSAGPGTPLVLALPRGGVPIGAEVARALGAELDIVVSRKIGMPGQAEYGVGAVTADGPAIFQSRGLVMAGLSSADLSPEVARQRQEARRRLSLYRGDRAAPVIAGRVAVVVDDGLATGVTAIAALREVRAHGPARLVFATPVGSVEAAQALTAEADLVICLCRPADFWAVGQWYASFPQLTDEDVEQALRGPVTGA